MHQVVEYLTTFHKLFLLNKSETRTIQVFFEVVLGVPEFYSSNE